MTYLNPEVRMGATILLYTDRIAGTIIQVTPKGITVQEDNTKRVDSNGISDSQEYTYSENLKGRIFKFRLNKHGVYANTKTGLRAKIGIRDHYYDFSF